MIYGEPASHFKPQKRTGASDHMILSTSSFLFLMITYKTHRKLKYNIPVSRYLIFRIYRSSPAVISSHASYGSCDHCPGMALCGQLFPVESRFELYGTVWKQAEVKRLFLRLQTKVSLRLLFPEPTSGYPYASRIPEALNYRASCSFFCAFVNSQPCSGPAVRIILPRPSSIPGKTADLLWKLKGQSKYRQGRISLLSMEVRSHPKHTVLSHPVCNSGILPCKCKFCFLVCFSDLCLSFGNFRK